VTTATLLSQIDEDRAFDNEGRDMASAEVLTAGERARN
jgi:hypothetical protein